MANGGGGNYASQNPTWQVLNTATYTLSYKSPLPSSVIYDATPNALYPYMFQLPHSSSIMVGAHASPPCHIFKDPRSVSFTGMLAGYAQVIDGVYTVFFAMTGDNIANLDRNFGLPPLFKWPPTFTTMATVVLLPLTHPNFAPEVGMLLEFTTSRAALAVQHKRTLLPLTSGSHRAEVQHAPLQVLIMGGADNNGTGLTYSQRMSNIGPGLTPVIVQEDMMGQGRIEGTAVVLPDGSVFLNSGAAMGMSPLTSFMSVVSCPSPGSKHCRPCVLQNLPTRSWMAGLCRL